MDGGFAVRGRGEGHLVLPPDGQLVVLPHALAVSHEVDDGLCRRGYQAARLDDRVVRPVTPPGAFRRPHQDVPPRGGVGPRSHGSLARRRDLIPNPLRSIPQDPVRGAGGTPTGRFVRRLPYTDHGEGAHYRAGPIALDGQDVALPPDAAAAAVPPTGTDVGTALVAGGAAGAILVREIEVVHSDEGRRDAGFAFMGRLFLELHPLATAAACVDGCIQHG